MTYTCQRCGYNWSNEKVHEELATTHPAYLGTPVHPSINSNAPDKLYGWECRKCENFHKCKSLKPYWKKNNE